MQCAGGDCQPWSDDSLQRVRYNFDMREEKGTDIRALSDVSDQRIRILYVQPARSTPGLILVPVG